MYCPDCGEPIDDCRCDLETERARELMFDDEDQELLFEEEY